MKTIPTESPLTRHLSDWEDSALRWMSRNSLACLQFSLGTIFLAFGLLKFFPGRSPAEFLAGETISILTFGIVSPRFSVPALGIVESLLGLGLFAALPRNGRLNPRSRILLRILVPILILHLLGTCSPLVLMPEDLFCFEPGKSLLTMECQYILKNVVLVSATMAVGGRLWASLPRVPGFSPK